MALHRSMASQSIKRARSMRKAMSPPELTLWQHLRALRSEGWHFRRQSPEPPYILDFVRRRAKLVVEVDGVHHSDAKQSAHDERRDAVLTQRGFRIMRFWASDVQREIEGVMEAIRAALGPSAPGPRAVPDSLPGPASKKPGFRYRSLVRLGLRRRD